MGLTPRQQKTAPNTAGDLNKMGESFPPLHSSRAAAEEKNENMGDRMFTCGEAFDRIVFRSGACTGAVFCLQNWPLHYFVQRANFGESFARRVRRCPSD